MISAPKQELALSPAFLPVTNTTVVLPSDVQKVAELRNLRARACVRAKHLSPQFYIQGARAAAFK